MNVGGGFGLRYAAASLLLAIAVLLSGATSALAGPNARIVHTIVKKHNVAPQMGRDLWFTMIQNYGGNTGDKYYNLYVASPMQTNIYVNMANQATKVLPVQPFGVASFNIPLSWEMTKSAIVVPNAIHVWSTDGDICAYLMSHNDYTSDGMYIIPAIGWGKDNVVAAYNALYEGGGAYVFDEPSEFALIANQDNTICTITPSCDIRIESSPKSCRTCLAHSKGIPFVEILNKGDAVQYETISAQDAENYDMTGTIIHSTNPVGVVGGSQCPNIPMGYPYCDHVCEMIPPTRTWADTYISAPFYPANPGKQWSSFLVIGTAANQIIYRDDPVVGHTQYCILGAQFSTYLRDDIDQPSKWFSDQPFLLVQYINSSTYPDGVNSQGDPAEVVINPVEQWTKTVVFQTPISIGNQSPFKNYVNILVNNNAVKSTKFMGKGIAGSTHLAVDADYSVYRIGGLKPGAYEVTSDSGVGVYIYGYGYDESYAWAGSFGTGTFNSPDTVPPVVIPDGECFHAHVFLSDTTKAPEPVASKLGYIRLDTIYNMAYQRDDPNWQEGVGKDSSFYDMFVLDSTKPAILVISIFDIAGNESIITSTYQPQFAALVPPATDFGIGKLITGPAVIMYDTIINKGTVPFSFNDLHLVIGGASGFTLVNPDLSPLAVGEKRIVEISFIPQVPTTSYDTLVFGDPCLKQQVIVYGTGGGADFRITNYDYGTLQIYDAANAGVPPNGPVVKFSDSAVNNPMPKASLSTHIVNLSKTQAIVITSIVSDDPHFVLDPSVKLPFTIDPLDGSKYAGDTTVNFIFTPTAVGSLTFPWHATSSSVGGDGKPLGPRNAKLTGAAAMAGQQLFRDTVITLSCAAAGDMIHIQDTLLATGTLGADITNVTHTADKDPNWTGFVAFLQNGNIADFSKNPEHLNQSDLLIVAEDFHETPGITKSYYDTITATTANGGSLTVHATINLVYREATVSQVPLTFAMAPYKGAAPPPQSFTIQNTAQTEVIVKNVHFPATPPGKYDAAFTITPSMPLPAALQAGQTLTVTLNFDPSISSDPLQTATMLVDYDGVEYPCAQNAIPLASAGTYLGAAAIQLTSTPTPILACDNQNVTLQVQNTTVQDPKGPQKEFVKTITVTGPDAALFTFNPATYVGQEFDAGTFLPVTLVFDPSGAAPSIASATTYNATVNVDLTTNRNDALSLQATTLHQDISGIAQGIQVAVASNFGQSQNIVNGNEAAASNSALISMPVNVTATGLTGSLSTRGINGVSLVYVFNSDLLDIVKGDIKGAFAGVNGWTVDPSSKLVMDSRRPTTGINFADTLYLLLDGASPLNDQMPTLGSLNYRVTLTDSLHMATDVTLASMTLLKDGAPPTSGCVATQVTGGNFNIILHCGNQILMDYMNGNTNFLFAQPATPNPATGGHITISYANREETHLTLAFTDELGHEVMRPMDNVDHESGSWQITCDVSKLASGNYTYRLTDGKRTISKQFVIQK